MFSLGKFKFGLFREVAFLYRWPLKQVRLYHDSTVILVYCPTLLSRQMDLGWTFNPQKRLSMECLAIMLPALYSKQRRYNMT